MATTYSQPPGRLTRREATVEAALDHAMAIVHESGAGAVTISEIGRRLGMRAPSVYKYFGSLHEVYDALFARGQARVSAYVAAAVQNEEPGLDRLLMAARACIRWATTPDGRALGPLLYWRPIPGFEPSPGAYEPSIEFNARFRADLSEAVRRGELAPSADTDDTLRVLTVLVSGICSQQMANNPGASYARGAFTRLTDHILDMFVASHLPKEQQ
jgi:AcrR family transcriptional regulator